MPTLPLADLHALLHRRGAAPSHHARIDALRRLCEQSPHCHAVALVGSFAQGGGDRLSDLDLAAFVADDREVDFMQAVDGLIGGADVMNVYGRTRPGEVAFRKYVYLDFSSCEFHAFPAAAPFRLRRPFIAFWDPHDHLETRVAEGEPPRHESFEPYPHGDEALTWELLDCIKWLSRGRTALARQYLVKLGTALRAADEAAPSPANVQPIRPDREVMTTQRLPYFIGISGGTVGATGLSMHLVVIPPGARAVPHLHVGYETGIYVLEGEVLTRWGAALEHEVISRAGEFLFIPPGVPHEAINLSATQAARAVVARNDPAEQDRVLPYAGSAAAGTRPTSR